MRVNFEKSNYIFLFLLIISGCTNKYLKIDTDMSQIVFLNHYNTLSVSTIITNESHQSKQFQLKVEIVDKQLQKALQTKELLVGEDEQPPGDWKTNGHIYQIKKKTEVEGGTTFNIHESISEKQLEKMIKKNAIKIILLDKKGDSLTSDFVHNFKVISDH